MTTHGDHQRALLVLLRSCAESVESPRRNGRSVQWRETNGIRFDRNNQAKLTTLCTISSRVSRSQFLEGDSHENDDE